MQIAESKIFIVHSLAALMGWCGVMSENIVSANLATAPDFKGCRRPLIGHHEGKAELAEELQLECDEVVFFEEKKIKALAERQPYPSESFSINASAAKGMSFLTCRPNAAGDVEREMEKK